MPTDLREQLVHALDGRYDVDRLIGAGGMATVYLARDVRHDRKVALKVLDPELAAAIGADRFVAEIRTTAGLQHPHILSLHDSGEAGGFLFYAMPYVAGETLRARLDREKQLPIADAVRIAKEIASALDYAHRHGVIHRDIKPDNILLHEGSALVADFGIALAVQSAGSTRLTQTGLSLGTPQYMSPEQAMGEKTIDARTDVYALGAVLYEMLVGEPPFTGATVQAIVAKVMTERPMAPRTVRPTIPAGVERATLTALEKLPADRFATAAAFSAALDHRASSGDAREPRVISAATQRRFVAGLLIVAVAFLGAGFGLARWTGFGRAAAHAPAAYVAASLAADAVGLHTLAARFDVSPDGERVVFRSVDSAGHGALFVRERGAVDARVLAGADTDAFAPFFSPDGRWIGYVSPTGIMKVPVAGGTPVLIHGTVRGGVAGGIGVKASWGADDRILFPTENQHVVAIVSSAGRPLDSLMFGSDTTVARAEALLHGRTLLWLGVRSRNDSAKTWIAVRDSGGSTRQLLEGYDPRVAPSGYLLFTRREANAWVLMAVAFDASTARLRGDEPITLARDVPVGFATPAAGTLDGDLVYMQGLPRTDRRIVTLDRQGNERFVTRGTRAWDGALDLSPDGTTLAEAVWDGGARSIWTIAVATGAMNRVTNVGDVFSPVWMPDGKTLVVGCPAGCGGPLMKAAAWIWRVDVDGASPLAPLVTPSVAFAGTVSAGDILYFDVLSSSTGADIWQLPLGNPAAKASPVVATAAEEMHAMGSPDERWLAFASQSSGKTQVRIGARSSPIATQQLTADGGFPLRFSRDGRKFFYSNGNDVWEVSIAANGPVVASARRAFQIPEGIYGVPVVSPDGDRIYAIRGGMMYSDLIVKQGVLARRK